MKVILKKMIHKQSVLSIERDDGSSTWSKLHRGLETHDLAHYAVETVLGFTKAFYGLINQGASIQDFELPKDERPYLVQPKNLHNEALITEHLVNLLEIELLNAGPNNIFLIEFRNILEENQLEFPDNLSEECLERIRKSYHDLVNQWLVLEDGETLEIEFELSP